MSRAQRPLYLACPSGMAGQGRKLEPDGESDSSRRGQLPHSSQDVSSSALAMPGNPHLGFLPRSAQAKLAEEVG